MELKLIVQCQQYPQIDRASQAARCTECCSISLFFITGLDGVHQCQTPCWFPHAHAQKRTRINTHIPALYINGTICSQLYMRQLTNYPTVPGLTDCFPWKQMTTVFILCPPWHYKIRLLTFPYAYILHAFFLILVSALFTESPGNSNLLYIYVYTTPKLRFFYET